MGSAVRAAWWGLMAVGIVLVLAGVYVISVSQSQMNYVRSCEKPVACGTVGNPVAQTFLTSSLTASLQQAQLGYVLGITALGMGLVSVAYGTYQYFQGRTGSELVQAGVAPP